MQNMESQVLPPLLNPCSTPLPPPFFFSFLKKLLQLKINSLSSIYPEINFPAEPVMKINNLSRPKVPAPPPPPSESNSRPLRLLKFPPPIHNNLMRLNAAVTFFFFFLLFTFLEKILCPPPHFRRRVTPLT